MAVWTLPRRLWVIALVITTGACHHDTRSAVAAQQVLEIIKEGTTAVLPCSVGNLGNSEVLWWQRLYMNKQPSILTRGDKRLTKDERFSVKSPKVKEWNLMIKKVKLADRGFYTCALDGNPAKRKLKIIKLVVTVPPRVRVANSRIGQVVGKDTILECNIRGYPPTGPYWSKGGKSINRSTSKYRIERFDEGDGTIALSLRIRGLDIRDYGQYTCSARNRFGVDKKTTVLYQVKRILVRVPQANVTAVQGRTATLPCAVVFKGKYNIAWIRLDSRGKSTVLTYQSKRVVSDDRFSVVRPTEKDWNLEIRDVTWQDRGKYQCRISVKPGEFEDVMLRVQVSPQIMDALSSTNKNQEVGSALRLVCRVKGQPKPKVTWHKLVAPSSHVWAKLKRTGEVLQIQNISRYDAGLYECRVYNGVPPAVSRKMRVTVLAAPRVSMPYGRIGHGLGKNTLLLCFIDNKPTGIHTWTKGTRTIGQSSKYRIETYKVGEYTTISSLRISRVEASDYGQYRCTSVNSLGQARQSVNLYKLDKESLK